VKILLDNWLFFNLFLNLFYFCILFNFVSKKRLFNISEVYFIIAVFIEISLFYLNLRLKLFICFIFFYKIVGLSYAMIYCLISDLSELLFTFFIILLNCSQICTQCDLTARLC